MDINQCLRQTTYFKNINSLFPATFLNIDTKIKLLPKKYWKPNFEEEKIYPMQTLLEMTHSLINAVKLRMRSDVP